jgi:adenylate cyclase
MSRQWPRIFVTLLPLLVVLLHAMGIQRIGFIQRIDDIIYDARLRATMPRNAGSSGS